MLCTGLWRGAGSFLMRSNYRCRTETMNYFICLKLENDGKYVRVEDGCLKKI